MRAGIIYKYESPSGKLYIGLTMNESLRKSLHKNLAKNPRDYFHRALAKYGFDSFKYDVIFRTASKDESRLKYLLNVMETYFIKKYDSNNPDKGYNLTEGGEGIFNPSDEVRLKKSMALKGIKKTDELKARISDTLKSKYESGEITVHNKRAIRAYLNGEFIGEFDSVEAARLALNIAYTSITNILKGRAKKTRLGYTFTYKQEGGIF